MVTVIEGNEDSPGSQATLPLSATARPIFIGWEKLRLRYNLILAGWCLFLMAVLTVPREEAFPFKVLPSCILGGIFANLCYLAGPILESYVAWIGLRQHDKLRLVLFCLGTLFTMLMARGVIGSILIHGFDLFLRDAREHLR